MIRIHNYEKFKFHANLSAKVSLGDFKGFRARNCEIRLIVYRAVEHAESRKYAHETNALNYCTSK